MAYPGKLTPRQRLELCAWLALGHSPSRVVDLCQEQFGITLSREGIDRNYLANPRWRKFISRIRRRFENHITDIPISNKAVRLRRLDEMYRDATKQNNDGFIQIKNKQWSVALAALREARLEMENTIPNERDAKNKTVNMIEIAKTVGLRRQARLVRQGSEI